VNRVRFYRMAPLEGTNWKCAERGGVRLFEAITFFGNAFSLGVIGLVTALVLAFQRR
jgi:hypothetical protein